MTISYDNQSSTSITDVREIKQFGMRKKFCLNLQWLSSGTNYFHVILQSSTQAVQANWSKLLIAESQYLWACFPDSFLQSQKLYLLTNSNFLFVSSPRLRYGDWHWYLFRKPKEAFLDPAKLHNEPNEQCKLKCCEDQFIIGYFDLWLFKWIVGVWLARRTFLNETSCRPSWKMGCRTFQK